MHLEDVAEEAVEETLALEELTEADEDVANSGDDARDDGEDGLDDVTNDGQESRQEGGDGVDEEGQDVAKEVGDGCCVVSRCVMAELLWRMLTGAKDGDDVLEGGDNLDNELDDKGDDTGDVNVGGDVDLANLNGGLDEDGDNGLDLSLDDRDDVLLLRVRGGAGVVASNGLVDGTGVLLDVGVDGLHVRVDGLVGGVGDRGVLGRGGLALGDGAGVLRGRADQAARVDLSSGGGETAEEKARKSKSGGEGETHFDGLVGKVGLICRRNEGLEERLKRVTEAGSCSWRSGSVVSEEGNCRLNQKQILILN